MGVLGELITIYYALPAIKQQNLTSLYMPNNLNWSFDSYTFILMVLFGYIPGFPKLYLHMLRQRGKYLEKEKIKVE